MLKNLFGFLYDVLQKELKEFIFPAHKPQPLGTLAPVPPPLVTPPPEVEDPLLDSAPQEPEPEEPKVISKQGFSPECLYCKRDTVFQASGRDVATNGGPISFGSWVCPNCFANLVMVTYRISPDEKDGHKTMVFWTNAKEHKEVRAREQKLALLLEQDEKNQQEKIALKGMKS